MIPPSEQELLEIAQIARQFNHFMAYLIKSRSDESARTVNAGADAVQVAQGRARYVDDLVKMFERARNGAR